MFFMSRYYVPSQVNNALFRITQYIRILNEGYQYPARISGSHFFPLEDKEHTRYGSIHLYVHWVINYLSLFSFLYVSYMCGRGFFCNFGYVQCGRFTLFNCYYYTKFHKVINTLNIVKTTFS